MNLVTRFASVVPIWTFFTIPIFVQAQTSPADFLLDLNQDGVIDSKDLLILIQKWGLQGIATPSPTHTFAPTSTHTPTPTATPTEIPTNPGSISVDLPGPLMKMVRIPAGSFMMGSPDTERGRATDEGPVHEVMISEDFYISATEVTQRQWEAVMGNNPATGSSVGSDYPVFNVSWEDCQAFVATLNALGQGNYRLPSEAEWEYACRAGTSSRFFFGNSLGCLDGCDNCETGSVVIAQKPTSSKAPNRFERDLVIETKQVVPFFRFRVDFMWYCANGGTSAHLVAQKLKNSWGLSDMAGNLYEWCQDSYHPDYTGAPTDGSAWETEGANNKVLRGGGFADFASGCRSARRAGVPPLSPQTFIGFRVVREP